MNGGEGGRSRLPCLYQNPGKSSTAARFEFPVTYRFNSALP